MAPRSAKSKLYPSFVSLKRGDLLDASAKEKIFPRIGLKNFEKNFSLAEDKFLVENLEHCLEMLLRHFKLSAKRCQDIYVSNEFNRLSSLIIENKNKCIQIKPTVDLVIPGLFVLFNRMFMAGTSIFDMLEWFSSANCNGELEFYRAINNSNSFRALQRDNLKICFSSSGNKGLWDIATMSMRGITSCQNWNSRHATHLVGSMADPYLGIIYIANKAKPSLQYGSRMVRRSLVRYAINKKTKEPALILERVYPHNYDIKLPDFLTANIFASLLGQKTRNKYKIYYAVGAIKDKFYLPYTKYTKSLSRMERSYRDSHVSYKTDPKYFDPSKLLKSDL